MYNMTFFAGLAPKMEKNALYPYNYTYKYPKAGEDNSLVTVLTYNLASRKTQSMDLGKETNQYIPRILWSPTGQLVIMRLNRLQNHLDMLYANVADGSSKVFYTEDNSRYIDEVNFDNLYFASKGDQFVFTSEKDGWQHIYLYRADGKLINQVTKGNWDVTQFLGYDEKNKIIYYQSAETSPIQRDVYAIKTDGSAKIKLSEKAGTNNAVFSSGYQYYINTYSNRTTPDYYTLHSNKGKLIRVLEGNTDLVAKLNETNFSAKNLLPSKRRGNDLNAWMNKTPVNFDPS
jgi:dipeptidyl-peptidase-4